MPALPALDLPVPPPVAPMLAKATHALPPGDDWMFEPKWDGFRTLLFRDGDQLLLQSRDQKPMNRYFPELVAGLPPQLPERCVLDGEVVIVGEAGLEFETLQMRIHPAESRVLMLAERTPAVFVAWDLLALRDEDLTATRFDARREALEQELQATAPPLFVTPCTADRSVAADWFARFEGAGFDGIVAKSPDGRYQPGKRAMVKVKHKRTVDCVVAGFRWHKNGKDSAIGSLLLGLFDAEGALQHVGVAASFTDARRQELVAELAPLRTNIDASHPWHAWRTAAEDAAGATARRPGAVSRWSRGKDLSWEPLRAEWVAEVSYDNLQGSRFRHTAHFVRWRTDKPPAECTFDQVETTPPVELAEIFGG